MISALFWSGCVALLITAGLFAEGGGSFGRETEERGVARLFFVILAAIAVLCARAA